VSLAGTFFSDMAIFMIGSICCPLIMIFFASQILPELFKQPKWLLTGGV